MLEDLNTVHALRKEIDWLRGGEEGGYTEGTFPTPGQLLKRLHDLDPGKRIERLGSVIAAAEVAHHCRMSLHEENLSELRQRVMTTWGALSRISEVCQNRGDSDLIPFQQIVGLLPEALRRG